LVANPDREATVNTAECRRLLLCAVVMSPLLPVIVSAQRPSEPPPGAGRAASTRLERPVEPGDRVRLWTAEHRAIGSLIVLSDSAVVIAEQQEGQTVQRTYRTGSLLSFEVSRGRHGHPITGIFLGAFVGTLAGVAIGNAACAGDDWGFCFGPLVGLVVGPPAGAILGGITGALIRTDRWVTVSRRRVAVSIAPTGRGITIGVRLRVM